MDNIKQSIALANSVIMVAQKFIDKVESGRAKSVETYSDMKNLINEAKLLKESLEPKPEQDNDPEKRMLTKDEAISLLPNKEHIHTFRDTPGILLGADWKRSSLIEAFDKYEDTLEITGGTARGMKHGLALRDDVGYLFIETDEEKLNALDPIDFDQERHPGLR